MFIKVNKTRGKLFVFTYINTQKLIYTKEQCDKNGCKKLIYQYLFFSAGKRYLAYLIALSRFSKIAKIDALDIFI